MKFTTIIPLVLLSQVIAAPVDTDAGVATTTSDYFADATGTATAVASDETSASSGVPDGLDLGSLTYTNATGTYSADEVSDKSVKDFFKNLFGGFLGSKTSNHKTESKVGNTIGKVAGFII